MARFDSGIRTTKDRRGQIAPSPAGGVGGPMMPVAVAPPDRGRLIPKQHAKGGEPAGTKNAHRIGRWERHGAQHRVMVPMRGGAPTATAAGINYAPAAATQANGRVIPSRMQRELWSGADFWEMAGSKF